jgi:hypothetical protein
MRLAYLALTAVLALMVANSPLRAQRFGSTYGKADCGCEAAPCDCGDCDACARACGVRLPPVLPAIANGVHCFMDTLFPCCGVQSVQDRCCRAAIVRNGSRGCCLPLFPIISYRGCVSTADDCCEGSVPTYDEELLPTPAASGPIPPEAQPHPSAPRPAEPAGIDQTRRMHRSPRSHQAAECRSCRAPSRFSAPPVPRRTVPRTASNHRPDHLAGTVPARFQPASARAMPAVTNPVRPVTATVRHAAPVPDNPLR